MEAVGAQTAASACCFFFTNNVLVWDMQEADQWLADWMINPFFPRQGDPSAAVDSVRTPRVTASGRDGLLGAQGHQSDQAIRLHVLVESLLAVRDWDLLNWFSLGVAVCMAACMAVCMAVCEAECGFAWLCTFF